MPRVKVKLQYIIDNAASRKVAFRKRKKCLLKKASELSTLCDIKVGMIMYSPYNDDPEVWPSELGVQEVVAQYKEMLEAKQKKIKLDHEGYLHRRIVKTTGQLNKQLKANREKEIEIMMNNALVGNDEIVKNLNALDLNDLSCFVDQNLNHIEYRMKVLKNLEGFADNFETENLPFDNDNNNNNNG